MIIISEFDFTLTIDDTFASCSQADHALKSPIEIYALGEEDAERNLKQGLAEHFDLARGDSIAIASFHNNPNYIAGHLARLLRCKLTLVDTCFIDSKKTMAIKQYRAEGYDKPVLISYIPAIGRTRSTYIAGLKNKNPQITFLRNKMLELGMMTREDTIDYFDCDELYCEHAKSMDNIRCHLIDVKSSVFSDISATPAPETRKVRFCEDDSEPPTPTQTDAQTFRWHSFFTQEPVEETSLFGLSPEGCCLQ